MKNSSDNWRLFKHRPEFCDPFCEGSKYKRHYQRKCFYWHFVFWHSRDSHKLTPPGPMNRNPDLPNSRPCPGRLFAKARAFIDCWCLGSTPNSSDPLATTRTTFIPDSAILSDALIASTSCIRGSIQSRNKYLMFYHILVLFLPSHVQGENLGWKYGITGKGVPADLFACDSNFREKMALKLTNALCTSFATLCNQEKEIKEY